MNTQETLVAPTWAIDPSHTEVKFKVKHLVISTVTGTFKLFDGAVNTQTENFDGASVRFSIDVNSLDTNSADRDNHLRSADFFDVANYPSISFENGVLRQISGSDYKLTGDLAIRGVTQPVELDVEYNGTVKDPWGNAKAGFEINGKVNRKDFNLTWNVITEAGGMLVGEDVKLEISAQLAIAQ